MWCTSPESRLCPPRESTKRDGCADRQPTESLRLGPDRSVAGGVILVHGVTRGKKSQLEVVLESRQCAFAPPVMATMAGARARVRNADLIIHSARGVQGNTTVFHVAIPGKEQEVDITRRLTKPGVVRILAERDPHMSAWMVVHDNPYVAVTDARGAFRIEDIPPGAYRVTMWHQGFRRRGHRPDGTARLRGTTHHHQRGGHRASGHGHCRLRAQVAIRFAREE